MIMSQTPASAGLALGAKQATSGLALGAKQSSNLGFNKYTQNPTTMNTMTSMKDGGPQTAASYYSGAAGGYQT